MDEEKFDGMFFTLAQQTQGVEPLLDTLFSFLRRKTDFFTGASKEKVESLVMDIVKKHATIHERDAKAKKLAAEKLEQKKREEAEKKKKV
jgi:16S rRNA G1207 methylase RsmC